MTMITPSYLGETIEYSSLHACRSTLEDPTNFGTGIASIDFGQGLGLGSLQYVCFMPDGSSRDNLGNYNSGVVYLNRPLDDKYSSRAISVWGATGRVRGWRLVQQAGAPVWMQQ